MEKALKFAMWALGIFVFICGVGRAFLFETWTVPDDPYLAASVGPTLKAGDLLLVLTVGEATWGDLVRCPDPDNAGQFVVGRILGMPRDEIELKGGTLTVNGSRYSTTEACQESVFEVPHPDTGAMVEMNCGRVELGNNWHFFGSAAKYASENDIQHSTGSQSVFLLSDNRDLHDDSRDYGALPLESCQQRVFFRLWGAAGWMSSDERLTFIR